MISSKDKWFEAWDDYYAKSDAKSERYHRELSEAMQEHLIHEEYMDYLHKVEQSGFDSEEEYEAYWKRAFKYYETETDQSIDRL